MPPKTFETDTEARAKLNRKTDLRIELYRLSGKRQIHKRVRRKETGEHAVATICTSNAAVFAQQLANSSAQCVVKQPNRDLVMRTDTRNAVL
jgi:tRNA threonylcarbamoyladenosine modification (KEOPS) complex Cgi121 subunit